MEGGGQLEENFNLSQLHFSLKGEACTGLGGREGENLQLPLPSAFQGRSLGYFCLKKP